VPAVQERSLPTDHGLLQLFELGHQLLPARGAQSAALSTVSTGHKKTTGSVVFSLPH
jgi:hypothetical protein